MKTQRVVQGSTKDGVGVVNKWASVPWVSQDFRESKQPKPVVPSPHYSSQLQTHEISAKHVWERGVLEKTKPERGLQPTLSIDGVAVSVTKSEGERGWKQNRKSRKGTTRLLWSQWPQNVPSTTKHSQIESQLPKVSSPTSSQSKKSSFPIIKQFFPKASSSISLASSIKNPKVFFRQPSSEQSQRKAEWPPWDLRLVSQMANLFNSTHECLGQKKSLEGVLHKCQLGCPSSESSSEGT